MKHALTLVVILATASALQAQKERGDTAAALIKKLGSGSFLERQAATKTLRNQPEAEPALREAMGAADFETKRRIEGILDHFDRKCVRDLDALAKKGQVDEVIKKVAAWPVGKYDQEVWSIMRELTANIYRRHCEKGGAKFRMPETTEAMTICPKILKLRSITQSTKADQGPYYFLRAHEINLNTSKRLSIRNYFHHEAFALASATANYNGGCPRITLAGGNVTILGGEVSGRIIISGGDVLLKCPIYGSLIIARGKIAHEGDGFFTNHVIAGKTAKTVFATGPNIMRENEPNPLGFIRWTDAPKKKAIPK